MCLFEFIWVGGGPTFMKHFKGIKEDLRNIGVGIWKRMAVDRDKWRIITGAVKAGTRL
jgi:hypothetical protein